MAERRVLAIGADAFLHGGFGPVPYAEDSARAVAAGLSPKPTLLLGNFATKSLVESRVRLLKQSAKSGDTLILVVRGHAEHLAALHELEARWVRDEQQPLVRRPPFGGDVGEDHPPGRGRGQAQRGALEQAAGERLRRAVDGPQHRRRTDRRVDDEPVADVVGAASEQDRLADVGPELAHASAERSGARSRPRTQQGPGRREPT